MKSAMRSSGLLKTGMMMLTTCFLFAGNVDTALGKCKKVKTAKAKAEVTYHFKTGSNPTHTHQIATAKGDAQSKHVTCAAGSRKNTLNLKHSACNEASGKLIKQLGGDPKQHKSSTYSLAAANMFCSGAAKSVRSINHIKYFSIKKVNVNCDNEDFHRGTLYGVVQVNAGKFTCEGGKAKEYKYPTTVSQWPAAQPPKKKEKKLFTNPKVSGYALDYCREWGKNCGKPAADAYCKSKGYKNAATYKKVDNKPPTRVIGTGQVCNSPGCDRLSFVACEK
ncbi:MAG: hypothetical protein D6B25_07430 [Desulfobulbaceae bacterium]|nr:MAG: hypothetical protein D6B25_07430 [Desulfobulbaceae bacterium]